MGESHHHIPPPYVICHLCGRKYGTKSIVIHVPQCEKKWYADNKKLPKNLRRRLPSQPDYDILQSGNYNPNMVDQLNEMSFKAAQSQLIPCANCGRTFYPEKLPVHQRSCTIDKPARPPVRCKTSPGIRNLEVDDQPHKNGNMRNKEISDKLKVGDVENSDIVKTKHNIDQNGTKYTQSNSSNNNHNTAPTILCSICMKQIPKRRIQVHLVQCNEEKIKDIYQETCTSEENCQSNENTRPRTRTIRRASVTVNDNLNENFTGNDNGTYTPENKKASTYDILKPNASYNIVKPDANYSDLIPCELCKRRFKEDRINQHKRVCSKVTKKERKLFDSSKQRLQGVVAPPGPSQNIKNRNKEDSNKSKSNWKQRHEEFIQAIRAAKQVSVHMAKGGKASDLPPPPPSLNPDYVHCKYCDRRFNKEVAGRHIPKCATTMNRPAPPKKKALDIYNNQTKNKGLKKSETFSVRSDGDRGSKLRNRLYSKSEKKDESAFSGYVSPRLEARYDSFDSNGDMDGNNNNVYRSLTTLGSKASGDDSDSSLKEKYLLMKKSLKKQHNAGYSYNTVKRKPPPKRDFVF